MPFALLLAAALAGGFRDPPADARMSMYWIWFGPSVTGREIDRDLANMRQAHIGGAVLLPVYPLDVEGNSDYLSPRFLDALKHAAEQAKREGQVFDVTIGTGWPYGGPWLAPELAARRIVLRSASQAPGAGEQVVATFGEQQVVSVPTRMMVKRASAGAEGLVLDHYNAKALQLHLDEAGEKLWRAVGPAGIRSFWCDSLEVFAANWTPEFPRHFERLR